MSAAALIARARGAVLPDWVKWAAVILLIVVAYGLERVQEARHGADAMLAYVGKEATAAAHIVVRQAKVSAVIQTKYVGRIRKIYIQGAAIEANIPTYIQPRDVEHFAVNAGFVRVLDAAWAGVLQDPPQILTENPPAFRSTQSLPSKQETPPAAAPGANRLLGGGSSMLRNKQ